MKCLLLFTFLWTNFSWGSGTYFPPGSLGPKTSKEARLKFFCTVRPKHERCQKLSINLKKDMPKKDKSASEEKEGAKGDN